MWTALEYPRSWGDIRCRELLFWFFVLSYVPGMLLIIVLENDFHLSVPEHLGTYFSVAWLAGFAGASFYRQSFRGCGQLFGCWLVSDRDRVLRASDESPAPRKKYPTRGEARNKVGERNDYH